jgi:methylene-fatty-acyl-phospholipid synthase
VTGILPFLSPTCFVLAFQELLCFLNGLSGTFLGDYFGILMESKVEGFPFNIMENPMYNGSSLLFVSTAIMYVHSSCFVVSADGAPAIRVQLASSSPFTLS